MKETIKSITGIASSFIPFSMTEKLHHHRFVVPLYHMVSDNVPVHIKHLYLPRKIKAFRNDMDFFSRHFNVLYPDKFTEYLCGSKPGSQPGFIPTFDDGLREVYGIVAPFLYQMGIPAIFFINNDFVDNKGMLFRFKAGILVEKITSCKSRATIGKLAELMGVKVTGKGGLKKRILGISFKEIYLLEKAADILELSFSEYLAVNKPYMDSEQIRELQEKGFIIGAHGRDHQLLSGLGEDEIIDHVKGSINGINKSFPSALRLFAFPFTDHGIPGKILRKLHDPVSPVVDASFGTAGLKQDIVHNHIQRIPMELPGISASRILKTQQILSFCRRNCGRDMITRK